MIDSRKSENQGYPTKVVPEWQFYYWHFWRNEKNFLMQKCGMLKFSKKIPFRCKCFSVNLSFRPKVTITITNGPSGIFYDNWISHAIYVYSNYFHLIDSIRTLKLHKIFDSGRCKVWIGENWKCAMILSFFRSAYTLWWLLRLGIFSCRLAQPQFIIIFGCCRSLQWLLINFHRFQLHRVYFIFCFLFFFFLFVKGIQCWPNGYVIPKIIITRTIYFRLTFLVFISFGGHRHRPANEPKTWWSTK